MAAASAPATTLRLAAFAGGPAAAAVAGVACHSAGLPAPACWTAVVTAWCAVWWVLEPIPIPATSLIPFVAFPLLGVLDHKKVATAYGHTLILLLLGGFLVSTALEKSGAHRRLALGMVRLVGGHSHKRLVLGFMLATTLASMWISNTAATLMMLPVAMALIEGDESEGLGAPLLLGIAYAASIGGLGTPIGTPPNVIFMGVYRETTHQDVSFLDWMRIGVPATFVLMPIAWWVVTRKLHAKSELVLPRVGPWRSAERRVLVVFALTALAWITRTEPFGGWSGLLSTPGASDSTVALGAALLLFLVPDGEGGALLDWPTAKKIPWGLLLLFAGGIAIARAFEESGLSKALGNTLSGLAGLPLPITVLGVCLAVTFLTEVTSNTATATLLMPVLSAAALGARMDPKQLMIPAALSASCAFMLPVATAPNAIVFGTERVTTRQMARHGFAINLMGAVAITVVCVVMLR
ncbi:MAG: SLC13/DASS family transporter [Myxococcales bacterium]|nr:SLC13/DASS family transporter [Myxococcales bacterium]MCB9576116.1 SLC13/DASS family transporter [Polyangiaceae bacterium]